MCDIYNLKTFFYFKLYTDHPEPRTEFFLVFFIILITYSEYKII